MTWVPLDVSSAADEAWADLWASRLWIWLLCAAQTATVAGVVHFAYSVVAARLAVVDGRKRREPSRKCLRRALQKLVAMERASVSEWEQGWEQARDLGGAQGYLTVKLSEWPPCGVAARVWGTGPKARSGTGSGIDRAAIGDSNKRGRGREDRNPTDSSSDSGAESNLEDRFRGLWNRAVDGRNVRRFNHRPRDRKTPRAIAAFLRDCEGDWTLLEACIDAYVRRDFHADRDRANRLGVDTFLRPSHRNDYIDRGRDFLGSGEGAQPDTPERRQGAARDLGCDPSDLSFDAATGEYRKNHHAEPTR